MREHLHADDFQERLQRELRSWVGRPTPLTFAARLSERWGAKIWLKREDLAHTGAHKINNAHRPGAAGPAARREADRRGDRRRPTRRGEARPRARAWDCPAPSTWVRSTWSARRPTSAACGCWARRSFPSPAAIGHCGPRSTRRCATGCPIRSIPTTARLGGRPASLSLPGARAAGRHRPRGARADVERGRGRLPDVVIACVGGGSNSIGAFHAFVPDSVGRDHRSRGGRPRQRARRQRGDARRTARPGVLHGSFSLLLQDADGQIQETHSVSAGLDYPGVGPEHALLLRPAGCATETATDEAGAGGACGSAASTKGFCRRSKALTRSSARERWAAQASRQRRSWSASPAAATKTCRHCRARCWRWRNEAARDASALRSARPRAEGEPALVAFLTAGYPSRERFREHLRAVAAGADVVEIGVPFTDPMADGVTIQRSSQAALAQGVSSALDSRGAAEPAMPKPVDDAAAADELSESAAGVRARAAGGGRGARRVSPASSFRICRSMRARSCALPRCARYRARADGHAGDAAGAHEDALRQQPGICLRGDDDGTTGKNVAVPRR